MRTVLFVAPFLLDATLRFVQAANSLAGVRLFVLTADGPERLPHGAQHFRLADPLDPRQIVIAARKIRESTGGLHRITGILENAQVQIAEAREMLGLPGIDARTAERFRDKAVMKEALRAAGLPCARHRLLRSDAEAQAFVEEVGFPIVLKPPAGAGCRATYRANNAAELAMTLSEVQPSPARETLAEEFITGEEFSYDAITIDGVTRFENIGRYYPGPLDVTRNDWIQWCVLLPREIGGAEFDPVRQIGPRVVATLGLTTGYTHMEWFRRADGSPVVSEIGCRPPGAQFVSVTSWAYDRSMYRAWAEAVINDAVSGTFDRQYAAGIAYLRGAEKGRVARIDGLEEAQQRVGRLVVEVQLPVVGRPKAGGYEGDGYVIVRHPDTEVVKRALGVLIDTVRVRYD
jgi:phosphoribosylaminoimidazole carboxylase (NCAIR synthetase)